ncbi:olfactory receptor 51G2-like [Rana temporaria]|uniref:olfactory receptor 51G2-like n=1 Tax=Rana temporaria TaxID=8407 RepID=UPI001AAC7FFE|nr:olfactory receptor 51G2-like [Rana temporaria]
MTESSDLRTVVLVGIPGLEDFYSWILGFFCLLYLLSLFGNFILILLIRTDESLQIPMYDLVSMLAIADLGLSLATIPTVLGVFSFQSMELPVPLCLLQMFFIHSFSVMESSILLAMSYDRFVAICNPLRYPSLLTRHLTRRLGLLTVLRSFAVILPIPVMVQTSRLCRSAMLSHAFCLHPDIMRLLCSKSTENNIYSMFAVISTMGLDAFLILLSYALILRAVFQLSLVSARWKVFRTCVRHISAVLLFYIPMISLSMIHRFAGPSSTFLHVPLAYLHFLLPPTLNPILYGMKTKMIYQSLIHSLRWASKNMV